MKFSSPMKVHTLSGAFHSGAISVAQHGSLGAIVSAHAHTDLSTVAAAQHHDHDRMSSVLAATYDVVAANTWETVASIVAASTYPLQLNARLLCVDATAVTRFGARLYNVTQAVAIAATESPMVSSNVPVGLTVSSSILGGVTAGDTIAIQVSADRATAQVLAVTSGVAAGISPSGISGFHFTD